MRKSFILLTICALAGLWSCQSRIEDETPITYASDESEVEITVAADRTPRNVPSATPDENIIDNLDILLFDSNGKFICWRATFKINGKLRTTLPVGKDYDAYFLANCRSFIGEMLPDKATEEQYRQQADWEVFRKTLVDANPQSKSGKTKRATLQKRRVSKSTKTTRTRKTVSPVLFCMTRAHRFLFV